MDKKKRTRSPGLPVMWFQFCYRSLNTNKGVDTVLYKFIDIKPDCKPNVNYVDLSDLEVVFGGTSKYWSLWSLNWINFVHRTDLLG